MVVSEAASKRLWVRFPRRPRRRSDSESNIESNNLQAVLDGPQASSGEEPEKEILPVEKNWDEYDLNEASQLLIEREERLFSKITEQEALEHHKEEVDHLNDDYRKLKDRVLQIVQGSLTLKEDDVDVLTSAIKAIYQQEEQDQLWNQRNQTPPVWRPFDLKELHYKTLASLVDDRLDSPPTPSGVESDQSSIQAGVISMGRRLKDDLVFVAKVVKLCYPPETNICNFYATKYHLTFSNRLSRIAEYGLGDKDCTFLLLWVNKYYPEILQNSELVGEINTASLEKLLPHKLLEPLEEQYLEKQESELMTFIGRVLNEEEQRWNDGQMPKREDGYYDRPVAIDIIPLINGMVTSAETVVGDLQNAQNLTHKLSLLMNRFKCIQDNIIKQNSLNSKAYVKAYLNSVKQFRDVLVQKEHLFLEDERKKCLFILDEMKQSAHKYLLSPVHVVLKPQYRKLGTSEWLNKDHVFEKLVVSLREQIEDLQGSAESSHQELICQFHEEVAAEYVRRLLKGKVKLKDKEQQQKASSVVKENAESLAKLFRRMGSKEAWLKEILNKIAEVLELQSLASIQMEVASLGMTYPDLSEKHVSALLKLKTNFSRANRRTIKETLSDTLKQPSGKNAQQFFSRV